MRQPDGPPPSWDEVLASFLAEVESTEALLESGVAVAPATALVAGDLWQLTMPPLTTDLPDDLCERARALHKRQRDLIARLQQELAAISRQQLALESQTISATPVTARRAVFVDQRA